MTLLLVDSYDHYNASTPTGKVTYFTSSPTFPAGRFGNGILVFDNDGVQYTIPTPGDAFTVGFAYQCVSHRGTSNRTVSFVDGAGALQCELRQNGAGLWTACRNGTVLETGTSLITAGIWYYIEVQVLIANASGRFILHINEETEIDFTGDTQTGAGSTASFLQFGTGVGSGSGSNHIQDDLYLVDDAGGSPTNTFLGDCRVECLFPSGNGNSSQFDGSDGNSTDNYLLVDEATPDSETTYVESPDVSDKDTYAYGNLATTAGTIYGVQALPWARKTDAGTRTFVSVARLSGTETDSAAKTASDSYQYQSDIREAKPGGGVWTVSDVNSAEFGVKVDS